MMDIWGYITPSVIAAGEITPQTAEEAEAARQYNSQIEEGLLKKGKWLKCADLYKTLCVIAFAVALFTAIGSPIAVMTAYLISGLGWLYLGLRYVYTSPLSFQWHYYRYGETFVGTKAPTRETDGSIVLAFLIALGLVMLGVFLFPDRPTVNRTVSWAAEGAFSLAMCLYVFFTKRHNVWSSAALGALPMLVTPFSGIFGAMMIYGAIMEEKRRRPLAELEGYPDFVPLTINYTNGGARKVGSYDKFNRPGGEDDEMESL
ncbi:MAG: hypothetical protein IJ071_12300 [Ruminococcus sp.]|nr:hypothetical protein [Ruminococcus sp.]